MVDRERGEARRGESLRKSVHDCKDAVVAVKTLKVADHLIWLSKMRLIRHQGQG